MALEYAVKQFGRIGPTHPTMNKKISKVETVTWTEPSDVVSVHVQLGTSVNDPFGQLVATSSAWKTNELILAEKNLIKYAMHENNVISLENHENEEKLRMP